MEIKEKREGGGGLKEWIKQPTSSFNLLIILSPIDPMVLKVDEKMLVRYIDLRAQLVFVSSISNE